MLCVGDYLAENARRRPAKIALVEGGRRWTYAALQDEVDALAAALLMRGVKPGDRIGILAASSADWARLYLAIARTGAVAAGLNYRETPDRLARMMADVGVSLLFADAACRLALAPISGLPEIADLSGPALDEMVARHKGQRVRVAVSPADIGVILFTGGTTGVSKGVPLTHANLFWNVLNEVIETRMSEWDTTLLATAMHHSAALNTWFLPHLYLGGTAVILREFSPGRWIEEMEREKVTNSFTPPTMARQVVKHPGADKANWSSFKRWYSGAGILPRHEREEMEALAPGLGIYYEYGLTEAGPIVTCLQPEDYDRAPESIGRAVRHCELWIRREDGSRASPGEVGELAVRGPAVMAGYYNRPEESAKVLHDGWLLTGDLGAMDEGGFVAFHDRAKDMIKTGGLNVYSQEVELVMARHPAVREVAVIGMPDEHWGERVTAVVTLHDGKTADEAELIAFARSHLGGYQTPKRVLFLSYEELPKNYLGKILKRELRRQLAAEKAA